MISDPDGTVLGNLIGLWHFLSGQEDNDTGLDDGIAQDGTFVGGATAADGQLVLSGFPDRFDVNATPEEDAPFDLSDGRIVTEFAQNENQFDNTLGGFQSIVSRGEFYDSASEGYFGIEVTTAGAVRVIHISNGVTISETTPDGFAPLGNTIVVSYDWSETSGGQFHVQNVTQDTVFNVATSAGVNMDIGDNDGTAFTFGARENVDENNDNDPNFIKYFYGTIDYVAIYDTSGTPPERDGIVTDGDDGDLIDVAYDGDPDGDFVDNEDSIFPPVGSNDDIIRANGGDDTIEAGEGSDDVDGGSGNDLINTDGGATPAAPDQSFPGVPGVPAVDADLDPNDDRDTVTAGTGNDTVSTGDDADSIDGGAGDDQLDGGLDDDTIEGGSGADDITGGAGNDLVRGGTGDDVIDTSDPTLPPLPDLGFPSYQGLPDVPADPVPDNDLDTVFGGDGNDTITTGDDADVISGGEGDDSIDAGLDADTVEGGGGADSIIGGEGSDSILGGGDNDTIYGGLGEGLDSTNIEDDLPGALADPRPDNGQDTIYGGAGDDQVFGQDDNDVLFGGSGNDTMNGGIDEDTLSGGTGEDLLLGGTGTDELFGGDGNDTLFGGVDTDADTVTGGADRDVLGALAGDEAIGGEAGDDFDRLIVSGGVGIVNFDETDPTGESGTVTIYDDNLDPAGTVVFSEIERVYAIDVSNEAGTSDAPPGVAGTAFDGPGQFPGGDRLNGIVEGTAGDDLIDLAYTGDPEGDRVDNDDAVIPLVDNEDLILSGDGNDTVLAGEDTDLVYAGAGDDELYGEDGNDGLAGGTGDDLLSGGAGFDVLVGGDGNDTLDGSGDVPSDGGDLMYGNFGDDRFQNVGPGEFIVGGEDLDDQDIDVLDLRGSAEPGGSLVIEEDPLDSEAGTVRYFDAGGTQTGTLTYSEIEDVIPCFTPGTQIATPRGEVPVEKLDVGDKIITRDNGIQEIRWLGKRTLLRAEMQKARHMQPILIRQGTLGDGLPERDMMVSPNHRVLVSNDKTALYFDESEVLVAAKHLTGLEGVDVVEERSVTYIHFMFDQHEVVLSDGAWTESFQPGDQSLAGIGNAQRQEIFELFPELNTHEGLKGYQAARRSLKRHEAFVLVS